MTMFFVSVNLHRYPSVRFCSSFFIFYSRQNYFHYFENILVKYLAFGSFLIGFYFQKSPCTKIEKGGKVISLNYKYQQSFNETDKKNFY